MKKVLLTSVLVASLTGCASMLPQPKHVALSSTFNAQDVAWFNSTGTGSITGQAFFQTRGGQPRTCAGLEVSLQPHSPYGDERLRAIYGNTESGFTPALAARVEFSPDDATYHQIRKTTVCDAQGNFSFTGLPAGKYVVTSAIAWTVPGGYTPDGGALLRSVDLSDGESKRIILTP